MQTKPITIKFANGTFVWEGKPLRIQADVTISNEDWKTAFAQKQRAIEDGEFGYLSDVVPNLYGVWARVQFDDVEYSIYTTFDKLRAFVN